MGFLVRTCLTEKLDRSWLCYGINVVLTSDSNKHTRGIPEAQHTRRVLAYRAEDFISVPVLAAKNTDAYVGVDVPEADGVV